MLIFEQGEVVGLDIGSSAVKIVALRKDDSGYAVTAAGITEITAGGDSRSTVRAIRECVMMTRLRTRKKLRTKLAVCSVSGPEVAVRDFELPVLSDKDVEGAVLLEAAQVCPFNANQAAVDYQLIHNGDDKTRGILVAATNTLMTRKIQFAKEAGLKCVLMDVDGLALLNCFNGLVNEHERSGTAILNVGSSYTTLAIMSEEGWPFIRDTNCAGDDIVRQIAAEINIPKETLKPILFGDSPDSGIELGDSLERACSELIADVSETLRFYAAQEKSTPVEKIFVCGGFAPAWGFVELLSNRLGTEVLLWNPFDNMRCEASKRSKDIYKKVGPAMAVAAGLAMRSIRNVACEQ